MKRIEVYIDEKFRLGFSVEIDDSEESLANALEKSAKMLRADSIKGFPKNAGQLKCMPSENPVKNE